MRFLGFGKPRPENGHRQRVAAWAREAAGLPAEAIVKVNEILCPDPACPGLETVLLIMVPGQRTRAVKVAKPADAVTQADVVAAVDAAG